MARQVYRYADTREVEVQSEKKGKRGIYRKRNEIIQIIVHKD
jgi:hypothetical protein